MTLKMMNEYKFRIIKEMREGNKIIMEN